MPIYEYKCSKCEKIIELFIFNKEKDEPPICEECKEEMVKILSSSSFVLKGNCWANDGYSKKGK